jgi:hypothetical protein
MHTVKERGGKPDRKPYPLPYGLRNPYRNLKSENSQDYALKPHRNCMFMNSALSTLKANNSVYILAYMTSQAIYSRNNGKMNFQ